MTTLQAQTPSFPPPAVQEASEPGSPGEEPKLTEARTSAFLRKDTAPASAVQEVSAASAVQEVSAEPRLLSLPTQEEESAQDSPSRSAREEMERAHVLAREYVRQAKAANTLRAYRADWHDFESWCAQHTLVALPAHAETVVLYLTQRAATHRVSTLQRRLTSISQAHQAAGHDAPTHDARVRTVWQGIRRVHGAAAQGKRPTLTATLRAIAHQLPDSPAGRRDRALLLVGFAAALRRSEIVALRVGDVQFTPEGLILHQRKSKTDQESQGRQIGIPHGARPDTCPVRALHAWLQLLAADAPPPSSTSGTPREDPSATGTPREDPPSATRTPREHAGQSREDPPLSAPEPPARPDEGHGSPDIPPLTALRQAPLFRSINRHGHISAQPLSDRAVALLVKKHVAALGLDPAQFAGHSLRAGFATSCAQAGVSERAIQGQTGHKSVQTLRRYIREGSLFRDNPAAQIGL